MKRRTRNLLLVTTSVMAVACFASACAKAKDSRLDVDLGDYEYAYNPEFVDEHDAFVNLDGVMDEPFWTQDRNYLKFTSMEIDVSVTTLLTEKGVYIGAQAVDPNIFYYGRFDMLNNSGFTIYVIAEENVAKSRHDSYPHPMYRLRLETDSAGDRRSYTQVRFDAGTNVVYDEGSTVSGVMTSEFFLSWDALNVDTSEGVPEHILIEPVYRKRWLNSGNDVVLKDLYPGFTEPDWPKRYFLFGENGYGNPDVEGCAVGNSLGGLAKTDRWDLTHGTGEQPYVTSSGGAEEVIFFKDVRAENVFVKAKVSDISSSGDFGLIVHTDEKFTYRAFHFSASAMLQGRLALSASRRGNASPYSGVYYGSSGLYSGTADGSGEVELSLIKAGTKLYFFLDGKHVYSEDIGTYLEDAVSPGFYTSSCQATFSDYEACALTDAEVLQKINGYGAAVIETPGAISGGSVSSSLLAVGQGDANYELFIQPERGYFLSSFEINGEDKWDDVRDKLDGTKYVVEYSGDQSEIEVEAKFTRIQLTKRVALSGTVLSTGGGRLAGASIAVKADNCKLLNYVDSASANGTYLINYLPVDGTELTAENGQTITLNGQYTITFTAYGHNPTTKEITLNQDSADQNEDVTLEVQTVGGSATLEGRWTYSSNTDGWDISEEADRKVTAHTGSAYHPLVFSDVIGSRAVVEYTFANHTDTSIPNYEKQPGVGVVLKNSSFTFAVIMVGKSVRMLPNAAWNDKSYVKPSEVEFDTSTLTDTDGDFQPVHVRFVHDGELFAMFVEVGGEWKLAYSENYTGLDDRTAYGLFVTGGGTTMSVEFSNYSILTDGDAEAFIYEKFYKQVTVNDAAGAGVSLGVPSGTYVRTGTVLHITAERDTVIGVYGTNYLYHGTPIAVTVDGELEVSTAALGETASFRGTLKGMASASVTAPDFSTARLVLNADGTEYVLLGGVNADGTFAFTAPKGTYHVTAYCDYFLPVTFDLSSDADNETAFERLRPMTSVAADTFTTSDGSDYEWEETEDSVTSAVAKSAFRELKYFPVYGEKYAVTVTIDKLDVRGANGADKTPMAGITLRAANVGYSFLIQGDGSLQEDEFRVYFVTTTGAYRAVHIAPHRFYEDGKVTLGVICDGTSIKLFVNKTLVKTITADTVEEGAKMVADGFIGSEVVVGISSIGSKATFRDFDASAKTEYIDELTERIVAKYNVTLTQSEDRVRVNGETSARVEAGEKVTFTITRGKAILEIDGKEYTLIEGETLEVEVTKDLDVKVTVLADDIGDTGEDIYD